MKKLIALAALLLFPTVSFAALDITSASVSPSTVEPNQNTVLSVTVHRTPNTVTVENDWTSTKIEAFGTSTCWDSPDFTIGEGTDTATTTLTATSTDGTYDVVVKVYRNNGCLNLRDTATTTLTVQTPPPPPAPAPAPAPQPQSSTPPGGRHPVWITTSTGSYWYCPNPLRQENDPFGHCAGKYVTSSTNASGFGFSIEAQIQSLIHQLIDAYAKLNALTK